MATLEDLLSPIPGPNPSGEDIRYSPVFDKLKDARRPNEDWLSESTGVDYKQVIKLAEEILLKKSKDLQVAVWLTEAYIYREQFEGFHKGLLLVKGLIETQWDTLYPELEDGDPGLRLAPLDWLGGSYLAIPLKQIPITRGPHNYLQYHEAQQLGKPPGEDEYGDEVDKRRELLAQAIEDGKITLDMFEAGFAKTPKQHFVDLANLLERIAETIEGLAALCEEKFTEEPPSFSKLLTAVQEISLSVNRLLDEKRELEPDDDQPPAEESAAEPEQEESTSEEYVERAPVAKKPAVRKRAVTGIEPQDFDDAADRLSAVAAWIRSQDLSNPSSYLMLRGYRWGELRASGSSPDYSLLEPPPTETRQLIKRLAMEGSWEDVLRQGEEAMATKAGRAWLDLQRYIVQGLEYQGYSAAAEGVKSALKSLLQDQPDLLNMTLLDDTPVANAETVQWIREHVLPPPPEPAAAAPEESTENYYEPEPAPVPVFRYEASETPSEGERPPDAFELAMQAASNGDKEEAIQILMREMAQERSGRGKFQRKMQLAQVCLAVGRAAIARPILEELTGEIEKRKLEDWEPSDMVAHTLALYYRALDGDNEKKQQLYNWICRLDPMQALACQK